MRKELMRATREHFNTELATEFPGFKKAANATLGPATDLYVMRAADDMFFFIFLVPNTKAYKDSFMVEVGWARSESPARAYLTNKSDIDPLEDGNIRLPYLWRSEWRSALEPWWEAGDPPSLENMEVFYSEDEIQRRLDRVPKLVEDAVAKIKRYAVSIFEIVATARGHSAPKF